MAKDTTSTVATNEEEQETDYEMNYELFNNWFIWSTKETVIEEDEDKVVS